MSTVPNRPADGIAEAESRPGTPTSTLLVWAGLVLLALVGARLLISAWDEGLAGGHDFVQDYAAIVKIGQGRNPYEPYNDVAQQLFGGPPHKGPLYSFHAPSSLPLVVWLLPFAKLGGYTGAFLAWGLVSLASLWAVCWATLRGLGAPRPAVMASLAALALVAFPAIRECFEEGQLNVVVAAGMVGCWAARRSGRSALAGVLLGIGFALKPIPGLFFLYYAWRRDWLLLATSGLTVAALSLVGVGLAGAEGTRLWATVNYPSHADLWPGYPDNASVRGFLTRIFGPSEWRPRPRLPLPYVTMLLWAGSGGLLMLAALVTAYGPSVKRPGVARRSASALEPLWRLLTPPPLARDDPRGDLEIAVLTVLTLLVTPIVWPHYYVVLIMPVAVLAAYLGRLVLDGSTRQDVGAVPAERGRSSDTNVAEATAAAPYDARQRVIPVIALLVVAASVAVLGRAHYVEPFAGVGGYHLMLLLALYGASLVALGWSVRDQGRGSMPAAAR